MSNLADYTLEAAFDEIVEGVFYIDTSALDGTDGLSDLDVFSGVYDQISDDVVDTITVTAGTDSLAGAVQASSLETELFNPQDPARWNPNNPASVLNAGTPGFVPMRPVRLRALADGAAPTPLTLSGNEITDAVRALGLSGDGLPAPAGVGIWPAATNLCTNGGFESNTTGWSGWNGAPSFFDRSNDRTPKFGAHEAKVALTGVGSTGVFYDTGNVLTGGDTYTYSVWVYNDGTANLNLRLREFNAGGGILSSDSFSAPVAATVGWQRLTHTRILDTFGVRLWMTVEQIAPAAQTFYIDGAQLETGSFASPYIHTDGATATRNAARVQAPASLLSQAQGWVAARVRMGAPSSADFRGRIMSLSDSVTGQRIELVAFTGGPITWNLSKVGGSVVTLSSAPVTWAAGDFYTIVAAWTPTTLYLSVNGGPFVSAAHSLMITPDTFEIGMNSVTNRWLSGNIDWFACGTGTLTDATAAWLHGELEDGRLPGPGDVNAYDEAAVCTAAWDAVDGSYTVPDVPYGLFWGFIRRADWKSDSRACDLYCEDLLMWADRVFPTIASTGPTTTGAAIGVILDAVGWTDVSYRSLDVGDTIDDFSADGSVSALQLIANLLQAERGTVFVRGDGVVVYEDRTRVQVRAAAATLADQPVSLESGIDLDSIYTRATVTKTGGATSTAVDAPSEELYGRADYPAIDSPYIPSDLAVPMLAADIVYDKKNGRPPVTVDLDNQDAATLNLIVSSPLQTVLAVDDARGGTTGDYVVQRVVHTVAKETHQASYTLTRRFVTSFTVDGSALDGTDPLRY